MKLSPSQLTKLLHFNVKKRFATLIVGAPGLGKTSITKGVVNLFALEGNPHELMLRHPVVDEPTDYKGLPGIVGGKAAFLPYGDLEVLCETQQPLICCLDDLGQANNSVQAAAMQLILERKINGHKISDKVVFVACTNRACDRAGVSGILDPLKSRFMTIVELEVSLEDWIAWANQVGMPSELIAFLRFRPTMLHDFKPSKEIKNYPCPRTVANVGEYLKAELPRELERPVFEGTAGEAFAIEFEKFLVVSRDLPTAEEIFSRPTKARLPKQLSEQYAICGALAHAVDDKTLGSMLTYTSRLKEDMQVMALRDTMVRKSTLMRHPEFIEWIDKNKNVFSLPQN